MKVTLESHLQSEARACIVCEVVGPHSYHLISDHLHGKPKTNRKLLNIALDVKCRCQCCCSCYTQKEHEHEVFFKKHYLSICDICAPSSLIRDRTYEFCVICARIPIPCGKCGQDNRKEFLYLPDRKQKMKMECFKCSTTINVRKAALTVTNFIDC